MKNKFSLEIRLLKNNNEVLQRFKCLCCQLVGTTKTRCLVLLALNL